MDQLGHRDHQLFATAREALLAAEALKKELEKQPRLDDVSIDAAIDEYETWMLVEKENKKQSCYVTGRRLRDYFRGQLDLPLRLLDEKTCKTRYEELTQSYATTTHHGALAQVKTYLSWAVRKGYLKTNPAANITPKGKKKHGKAQLRIDEARLFLKKAIEYADKGEAGGVAA